MNAYLILLAILVAIAVSLSTNIFIEKVQNLDFGSHFKPKRQRKVEKCSKCGRKIIKGECVGCVVDYHGHTEWYCENCNKEVWSDCPHVPPHDKEKV